MRLKNKTKAKNVRILPNVFSARSGISRFVYPDLHQPYGSIVKTFGAFGVGKKLLQRLCETFLCTFRSKVNFKLENLALNERNEVRAREKKLHLSSFDIH